MEPNFGNQEEFDRNIKGLIGMLHKILKSHKLDGQDLGSMLDKKNVNLNLCFFTFMPVGHDDLEDMESIFEEYLGREEAREKLNFELNSTDIDFLKQNGMKF